MGPDHSAAVEAWLKSDAPVKPRHVMGLLDGIKEATAAALKQERERIAELETEVARLRRELEADR